MFESRMTFETSLSAVNGGHTTMSASLILARSSLRPRTRSRASATVLFIFQLPAMISFRSLFMGLNSFVVQYRDARQNFPFQEFEAGPAAGAHKGDLLAKPGFIYRFHTVATADDALSAAFACDFGHSVGKGEGSFRKSFVLEQPHRTVP